jgi:hypothetical protein
LILRASRYFSNWAKDLAKKLLMLEESTVFFAWVLATVWVGNNGVVVTGVVTGVVAAFAAVIIFAVVVATVTVGRRGTQGLARRSGVKWFM